MNEMPEAQRHDHDSPWKEILSISFHEFMDFFFPAVSQEIAWNRGYELLDKELCQITREAEGGKRIADQLIKVWKQSGEETWKRKTMTSRAPAGNLP